MTLEQIALELGITRERVRQIEAVALSKFRKRMARRMRQLGLETADILALFDRMAPGDAPRRSSR